MTDTDERSAASRMSGQRGARRRARLRPSAGPVDIRGVRRVPCDIPPVPVNPAELSMANENPTFLANENPTVLA